MDTGGLGDVAPQRLVPLRPHLSRPPPPPRPFWGRFVQFSQQNERRQKSPKVDLKKQPKIPTFSNDFFSPKPPENGESRPKPRGPARLFIAAYGALGGGGQKSHINGVFVGKGKKRSGGGVRSRAPRAMGRPPPAAALLLTALWGRCGARGGRGWGRGRGIP